MASGPRKLALTAHVAASVGWAGAVMTFLGMALIGWWGSDDGRLTQAMYIAMDALAWTVLVPLAVASLATGVLQALGTPWGLVRHYWVIVKLVITVAATGVLLLYTETLDALGDAAYLSDQAGDPSAASLSPVLHAGVALAALICAIGLSVYKPRGLTPYGWRKQNAQRMG